MKAREYCCCAIPIVNAGIYATLIEQLSLGVLVGTLSIATPSIVGAATPSFAPWILGIIAYVAAGVQILGFIGVSREKTALYKRYVTLHGIVTAAAFSLAAAWAIISATRHSAAKTKCINDFFTSSDGANASEGDTLCTIFPWVDVGIMGALWVVLAILHAYFFVVLSSYGKSQRRDHDQYDRVYDPTQPLTESIPLQNDPWDSRPSNDYQDKPGYADRDYKHTRQPSAMSTSEVLSQQYQEPKDSFAQNYSLSQEPDYPSYARTPASVPTPTANYYQTAYSSNNGLERPSQAQPHPAEGSFRRKTPRIG